MTANKTGMLWLDNDPARTLADKVARAVAHYQEKYGRLPMVCYINPNAIPDGMAMGAAAGVLIVQDKHTLPHHFLLCEEATE